MGLRESIIKVIKEGYYGTMGAGILPVCPSTGRVLVGLRSEDVNEPHMWNLFGGKIESGEDVEEGARRELEEETGYYGNLRLVNACVYRKSNFEYHNFFGVVNEEFEPTLNWENDEAEWVTLEELKKLKNKHFGLKGLLQKSGNVLERLLNSY